jgi:hypothetical protein
MSRAFQSIEDATRFICGAPPLARAGLAAGGRPFRPPTLASPGSGGASTFMSSCASCSVLFRLSPAIR